MNVDAAISSTDIQNPARPASARPVSSQTGTSANAASTAPVREGDIGPGPIASLSILVPVMNEEGNLPELYTRLLTSLERLALPFEIIFVDDGS
ncbi:MAG: glycosyltransferase, partial [Chloroflexota bacterium]|nr:glycosyltransferase [Chloroflexota bacterium]